MTILICILELIALCGITNIVVRSYFFQGFRDWFINPNLRYLVNCAQCTGFWVGVLFAPFCTGYYLMFPVIGHVFYACAVSILSSAFIAGLDYVSFAKSYLVQKIKDESDDAS